MFYREGLLVLGWLDPLGLGTPVSLALAALLFLVVRHFREMGCVNRLQSKAVFVTGCDTGLGAAYAKALDELGMLVFAGCLTEESVEAWRTRPGVSASLTPLRVDVRSDQSLAQAIDLIRKELHQRGLSGLWALVTNAGIRQASVPEDWQTSMGAYEAVTSVNLLGTVRTVQAAKPLLRASPGGARIVLIESMYGLGAAAFQSAGPYMVTKKAIDCYCDLLRKECRYVGITVHGILPGFHQTKVASAEVACREAEEAWAALSPDLKTLYPAAFRDWFVGSMRQSLGFLMQDNFEEPVWAVRHAVTAKNPRAKYVLSWVVKLFAFLHLLPYHVQDCLEDLSLRLMGMPRLQPTPQSA